MAAEPCRLISKVYCMRVLGIESSCDETAAAVVADGRTILSSVVASQAELHHPYGGVVPELAARSHIEAIDGVVAQALSEAQLRPDQIDAVAVTQGPGLVGALLVGFSYAKSYAYGLRKPWVGVDHLIGHLQSILLSKGPNPDFPYLALLVSGGHTAIYKVDSQLEVKLLGQTRDDAAGEAYDKVAKLLELGYPGGALIDRLARQGEPGKMQLPRPMREDASFDFSFSGLKSAVVRLVQERGLPRGEQLVDLAAEFQAAVSEVLVAKLIAAASATKVNAVALVGGVAANQGLRAHLLKTAAEHGLNVFLPELSLCGDNAAMIAAAGYHQVVDGQRGTLIDDVYSRSQAGLPR